LCARERISRNNRPIQRRYKAIILCGPTCCMLVDYPLYKSYLKLTNLQICTWSKLKIVLFWHEIVSFPILQTQNSSQQLSSLDPKMFHKYFNLIFIPSIKTTSAHKVDEIIQYTIFSEKIIGLLWSHESISEHFHWPQQLQSFTYLSLYCLFV
jgi:hypothetical protein